MAIEVEMPKLAMTMEEGSVANWYKNEGDEIAEGEPLFSVETEKVTSDIDAPESGILGKILVPVGETAPCGAVLAVILSPEEWQKQGGKPTKTKQAPPVTKASVTEPSPAKVPEGVKVIRLKGRKKLIADNTLRAWQSMPMYCQAVDADASALQNLRTQLLPELERQTGGRLTLTDLLVKILAWGLKESPELNAYLEGDELQLIDQINIGVSSATPQGLIIPVVHDADKKSLVEISETVRDLTERARQDKLNLDDISGGTFTLNNVGPIGVETGFSIISPPQVAILGVGRIVKKPVVRDDKVVVSPVMSLFINVNHRACDGITSAAFLGKIKSAIEDPTIVGPWY
jgi:pyruvate dehydrogenase E2 component (dihydrolipoamide acetyltransferase)